tara:strand:+ start:502 stop:1644 length:1143 start_codon:yes stop_codon:yes gene_type:complete
MSADQDTYLARVRENPEDGGVFIYQGKDITSLLIKDPSSLSEEEVKQLRECYSVYGRNFFYKVATEYKIIPFVAHILITLECDIPYWEEEHDLFVKRNTLLIELLERIFDSVSKFSCHSLTLTENLGAVLASDSCVGCFCSGDIDLSADINEINEIISLMKSFNFKAKEQPTSIGEYSGQSMQFFNPEITEKGFWINVIWKPVTRAFLIQDRYELRLSKDRLDAPKKDNSHIRILEDTSLLYFCALHISAGHYFTLNPGLRLYVDIDRIVRNCAIDWDELKKWEIEDKAGIRISLVLYLSKRLLDTPVPATFFEHLYKHKRNRRLIDYLYDNNKNTIQAKSSLLRRLYIELLSDNKVLLVNLIYRSIQLIISKIPFFRSF